jgi:formate C-acetyltransferase
MPISLRCGERIVGTPEFRSRTPAEEKELKKREPVLASIPPLPGGDNGHFQPDFEKLFRLGIAGILSEIRSQDLRQAFYQACEMVLQGMSGYCVRVARECDGNALHADTKDERARSRWLELAGICRKISSAPPETFREALQLMFLAIICLWFGEDHGLTCPGRMDRTLGRFYEEDRKAGRLSREEALELICCFYIQLNRILFPGSALAVMVGGRTADGEDVTNELTYLCLAARKLTGLIYPTVGLAWHEGIPSDLVDFSCRVIGTGIGDPAFFNDELISRSLRDHGVSEADSVNYMNSTCVEIKPVGSSHIWVTSPYFNCPKAVLEVLQRVALGSTAYPEGFEQFCALVRARLAEEVRQAAARNDRIWRERAANGGSPLASCLISDCLEKGLDFDRGGARYNWVENSFVGLANLVDSLFTIKRLVFESKELSIPRLQEALDADFHGFEPLRFRIVNLLPKYGNDRDEVDDLAVDWADILCTTTEENTIGPHRYVPGFFCWIVHELFGSETGATPDGRRSGFPLADGAGAAQGRERGGPTASILSTTKWSHRKAVGGLVHNLKLGESSLKKEEERLALRGLLETYLKRGGFEIQVNVVSTEKLREAQRNPDQYGDLIVRVAGYSDYFVHLNRNMQDEIIARTEHSLSG